MNVLLSFPHCSPYILTVQSSLMLAEITPLQYPIPNGPEFKETPSSKETAASNASYTVEQRNKRQFHSHLVIKSLKLNSALEMLKYQEKTASHHRIHSHEVISLAGTISCPHTTVRITAHCITLGAA